jgi:hypothetical protein
LDYFDVHRAKVACTVLIINGTNTENFCCQYDSMAVKNYAATLAFGEQNHNLVLRSLNGSASSFALRSFTHGIANGSAFSKMA